MTPPLSFATSAVDATVVVNTFTEFTVTGKVATLPDPTKAAAGDIVGIASAFSSGTTRVNPGGTVGVTNPAFIIPQYGCNWFRFNGTKWRIISAGCASDTSSTSYI